MPKKKNAEKVSIKVNDKYIEKEEAAKLIMGKVFFTKICSFIGIFSGLLIYGCFLFSPTAAFVTLAIFMCGFIFLLFKSEQDLNYFSNKYDIPKPTLIKKPIPTKTNIQ